jgi:hypothetical protein
MAVVDLISSGLGLVRSDADITPAWVEGVLRGSGALEAGVSVTGVSLERIGEGVGILRSSSGSSRRIRVQHRPPRASW